MRFSKKGIKIIISGVVSIALYFILIEPVYVFFKNSYDGVFEDHQRYSWVFADTAEYIEKWSGIGHKRDSDIAYMYQFKNRVYAIVFEYVDLNDINFDNIVFDYQNHFDNFKDGRLLYDELSNIPKYSIKNHLDFKKSLKVLFSKNSALRIIKDTNNCLIYHGSLNKMQLNNFEGESFVQFDFRPVKKTMIAFLKKESKFIIVVFTSDRIPLDEGFINYLKLE